VTTVGILLAIIGALGAFDIAYFHHHRAQLSTRPESRREAIIHVARGVIYTLQFSLVPNVRLTGVWYLGFIALFIADAAIAVLDVLEEPRSRRELGGLFGGEYLAHIVLSVLVGAMLHAFFSSTWHWIALPSQVTVEPSMPQALAGVLTLMAFGCAAVTMFELAASIDAALGRPRPLHIRARIRASLEELWRYTQDHHVHPTWDARFSRIIMLADTIETGTTMRYERDLFGLTIRGFGRYKLHRPLRQSTFEFWSDDPRSLIRRGVGLWLYRPASDGTIDFFTAYTYDVRWGALGRIIDRLFFRTALLKMTERSFARLQRRFEAQGKQAETAASPSPVSTESRSTEAASATQLPCEQPFEPSHAV
jgi:hypothetical protein